MTPPKQRVLFVDDEPEVLDGLRNLLRKKRRVWDMVFAVGAQEALRRIEAEPFDVVVSDVRMPGMDGVALLEKVQEIQPAAARLILSGHADTEASLRAAKVAHRFLSKPCDPALLSAAVASACNLQATLRDPAIKQLLGRADGIAVAPAVYVELCEAAADPDVGVSALAAIVERDPALAAKVLQLVNSSYFGLGRTIASIRTAVSYLGAETLRDLAMVAHVFGRGDAELGMDALAAHSLLAARIVHRLALPGADADTAATAALLHDVGYAALAMADPKGLARLRRQGKVGQQTLEAERAAWGATHAEIGAYVLGLWGLPAPVVRAVAFHHNPEAAVGDPLVLSVHVASGLTHIHDAEDPLEAGLVDPAALADAGLLGHLDAWIAAARDVVQEARQAA